MSFSIAPQSVTLPGGGPTLVFASGDPDTSKVTLTVAGRNADGNDGTHVFTFNRNGALQGDPVFTPTVAPHPLAGFKSVDDDAVRTDKISGAPMSELKETFPGKPPLPANKQPIPAPLPSGLSGLPNANPNDKTVTSKSLDQAPDL